MLELVHALPGRRSRAAVHEVFKYFAYIEKQFWKSEKTGFVGRKVFEEAREKKRTAQRAFEAWTNDKKKRKTDHNHARDNLAIRLSASTEVRVSNGMRCDVVSNDLAIEVKELACWHHAVGQAQVYALLLGKKPAVHFYDGEPSELIINTCAALNIRIIR